MKHIFDPEKCEWLNNQGFINARVEKLYSQSENMLKAYAATLTEDQRNQARSHLKTVLKLGEK
jgi:hypothetical protein